ncbi:MAG: hypothetical protein M1818_002328 [Claussenomyces sp. TS43310]|nr:MAG: hypothetical protein M1818_002328 [Claussenomyces sp. TS43310]
MESLLHTGKYSDLGISCGAQFWKVHRAVVCTQSPVLAKMIDGGFKEAETRDIILDDDSKIVEKMLSFLYKGDYDDERERHEGTPENSSPSKDGQEKEVADASGDEPAASTEEDAWTFGAPHFGNRSPEIGRDRAADISPHALLINIKVYIIADMYDIPPLKDLASSKYAEIADGLWAEDAFTSSARLLYENTMASDHQLRDLVAQISQQHIVTLIEKKEFIDLLVSEGNLAVDILKSVLETGVFPAVVTGEKLSKKLKKKLASRNL